MIYGVIGQRDHNGCEYRNFDYITQVMGSFSDADTIISGGARGVEEMVGRWATGAGKNFRIIPPNINVHGVRSGFLIRNTEIVSASDALVMFWDGKMDGYTDIISLCMREGMEVFVLPMK